MTREALNLLAIASHTRVRDLLTQPPYAFVLSVADEAAVQGRSPRPVFTAVKPSSPPR